MKGLVAITFVVSPVCTDAGKVLEFICFCFFSECIILSPFGPGDWVAGLLFLRGFCLLSSVIRRLTYHTLGPEESCLPSVQQVPRRTGVPECQVEERWEDLCSAWSGLKFWTCCNFD